MSGILGPQCKSEGEAIAAASAIAGMKAPKGMTAKISVTGVSKVGNMFAASVAVEFVPVAGHEAEPANEIPTDDGKTEGEGEGEASKTSEATDVYALTPAQKNALDASVTDLSMLPRDNPLPDPTPIIQSMEQLPDPDQDLLVAEAEDGGPQSSEAFAMAEDMKNEFNDQLDDLLVIGSLSNTLEQHASNEAHNQKELDAEETRREIAEANAANTQKEAFTPDPVA